jgi:hypothetical protein
MLVLGEELITLEELQEFSQDSFSMNTPCRKGDAVRVLARKDNDVPDVKYCISPPPGYSQDQDNVDLSFADGLSGLGGPAVVTDLDAAGDASALDLLPLGLTWDADIQWNEETRTVSWKPAGNATGYRVLIYRISKVIKEPVKSLDSGGHQLLHSGTLGEESGYLNPMALATYIMAYAESTSLSFPENLDVAGVTTIRITPLWAEAFAGYPIDGAGMLLLLPQQMVSGTVIIYHSHENTYTAKEMIK